MKFIPKQYQKDCIKFIDDNPKSALFLDMGLGKTVIILTHIHEKLLDCLSIRHALIVAPLRVATVTWPAEIEKWDHTRVLTYHVLHGKGRTVDAPRVNITLTNYETLQWMRKYPHIFNRFDYVVFDESTWLKNHTSKRWQTAFSMFGTRQHIKLLTGTPIPNGLEDIWGQMFWLDHGARLGRTKSTFMQEYFLQGGYMQYKYLPRSGSLQRVTDKVKDIAKTLKAKDYVQLPSILFNDISVKLPSDVMDRYAKFEREFLIQIGGQEIIAFNTATLGMKLRQCVQGFIYDEDKRALRLHDEKIKALEELLKTSPANFLVAVNFKAEIEMLRKHFLSYQPMAVYGDTSPQESARAVHAWNSGNLRLLFAHPQSLGHGMNLQQGGFTVVWMGPTWNLEHWLQFNKRLHRMGQTKPVIIHTIVAENTVDSVVSAALKGKDVTQEKLLQGLINYQKSM
jgi:SNF2 family DNA or RNA helicase